MLYTASLSMGQPYPAQQDAPFHNPRFGVSFPGLRQQPDIATFGNKPSAPSANLGLIATVLSLASVLTAVLPLGSFPNRAASAPSQDELSLTSNSHGVVPPQYHRRHRLPPPGPIGPQKRYNGPRQHPVA